MNGHCAGCGEYIGTDDLCGYCRISQIERRRELETDACAGLTNEELEALGVGGVKQAMDDSAEIAQDDAIDALNTVLSGLWR